MQCAVLEEETLRAYFAFLHETTHPDGDRSHRLCDHNFALPHENRSRQGVFEPVECCWDARNAYEKMATSSLLFLIYE
jgi:hypothetical protein